MMPRANDKMYSDTPTTAMTFTELLDEWLTMREAGPMLGIGKHTDEAYAARFAALEHTLNYLVQR